MNGYICGFNGKQIEVRADSLYQAKVKAIAEFKPAKSRMHDIWVELVELGGEQITSVITN